MPNFGKMRKLQSGLKNSLNKRPDMILIRVWTYFGLQVFCGNVNWTLPWIGPNSLVASELTGPFGLNLVWIIQVKAGPVVSWHSHTSAFTYSRPFIRAHGSLWGLWSLGHAFVDYLRSQLNLANLKFFPSVIWWALSFSPLEALLMLTGRKDLY